MVKKENWDGTDLGAAPSTNESTGNREQSYSEFNSFSRKNQYDLERECIEFMARHSFSLEKIVANDSWQRLSIDGGNDDDEWYIAHAGVSEKGTPWLICTFGTFAGGFQVFGTFKSWETDNTFSLEEHKEYEREFAEWTKKNQTRKADEERERIQKAQAIWKDSLEEPLDQIGHLGYLSRKKIERHGIRFSYAPFNDGSKENPKWNRHPTILIPLRNIDGEILAVQHIRADGEKRIYGPKKGNFHIIGEISGKDCIYVAEGYATAASVYEAKGIPTIVAFDCGNLDPVIVNLRKRYPRNSIIILGDDDIATEGNPGRTKAEAAAKKNGCKVVFPKFSIDSNLPLDENGETKQSIDWNDLWVHFGVDAVKKQLEAFERTKPRLITFTHKELMQKDIPPRKFILKPWLPEAAISMIFAPPGVGKSYLCLSAAVVIASGGQLFRCSPWSAPEPKRVLYIDGEMHEGDLQTRVKKLLCEFGKNIPIDYLRYMNGTWQSEFMPDLSSIEGQKLVDEVIAEQGTQVLFLDNLSTLCRTGKENETDSWKSMQAWLLQLRWKGITTVLVHHAGKAKDENGKPRQRGTSMREVILESSIVLDRPKDYSEEMGCVFELSYAKARGFYGADAVAMEVRLVEKGDMFIWEDKKLSIKNYDSVVDLYNDGTTSTKEIATELGISVQAVRKHLKRAKVDGDIK